MENSVLIQNLTADDLCERICSAMMEKLKDQFPSKKEDPRYLTRKEAARFLKISVPTLHSYTKEGKVTAFRVGRRVLYRMSDLEMDMERVEISRYAKGKNIPEVAINSRSN